MLATKYKEEIDNFLSKEDKNACTNEQLLMPTLLTFKAMIDNGKVVTDKTGVRVVELLAWQCKGLNPWQPLLNFNGKGTSKDYCKAELSWYMSQDLSVKDIGEKAKIWKQISSDKGEVNSNYGWCIFSEDNYQQYLNVLEELIKSPDSRRAVMIFTRPSMWEDYNKDGMSDFICTWGVHCFIRDEKLYYIINQRSCDMWFGLRNDFAFHCFVYQMLYRELSKKMKLYYSKDTIIYNCDTIHLYERHFDLCRTICQSIDSIDISVTVE